MAGNTSKVVSMFSRYQAEVVEVEVSSAAETLSEDKISAVARLEISQLSSY